MSPHAVARSPLAATLALVGGATLVASLFIPWGRYASGEPVSPAAMLGASFPPASPATVIVIILAFLFGAVYWLPPLLLFLLASLPFVAPRALARRGPMAVVLAFMLVLSLFLTILSAFHGAFGAFSGTFSALPGIALALVAFAGIGVMVSWWRRSLGHADVTSAHVAALAVSAAGLSLLFTASWIIGWLFPLLQIGPGATGHVLDVGVGVAVAGAVCGLLAGVALFRTAPHPGRTDARDDAGIATR